MNESSQIPSYGVSLNTTQVVDDVNLTTAVQEVPQIQTTVTENGPEVVSIVNAPFVQVTSVNGKTGDVTVDAKVEQFKTNKQYSEGSLCVNSGSLYIAKRAFTSGSSFNPNDWIQVQGGGGGGASVQSDWKASNISDPAYIKNKPTNLKQIDNTYIPFTQDEKNKLSQTKILTQSEKDKLATTEIFTSVEKNKLASTEILTQNEKNKLSETQIFTPVEKNKLSQTQVFSQQDKTKLDNLESISPADKAKLQLLQEPFTTAEKNKLAQTQIFTQQEKTKLQTLESITAQDKAKLALLDQPYTQAEKTKLAGIETGAQRNVPQVQADWQQSNSSQPSFIKNKPNNLVTDSRYVHTDNNFTNELKDRVMKDYILKEEGSVERENIDFSTMTIGNNDMMGVIYLGGVKHNVYTKNINQRANFVGQQVYNIAHGLPAGKFNILMIQASAALGSEEQFISLPHVESVHHLRWGYDNQYVWFLPTYSWGNKAVRVFIMYALAQ
jgi:hypothetical protein